MGQEIEKKWTVDPNKVAELTKGRIGETIYQFYLPHTSNDMAVRFRSVKVNDLENYFCTIKHSINSFRRKEFEFPMPEFEFNELKESYGRYKYISKTRYKFDGFELDVFHGKLEGLVLVEREFDSEEEAHDFESPEFVKREVTENYIYANSHLIHNSTSIEYLMR